MPVGQVGQDQDNGEDKGEVWMTSDIDFDFVAFNKNLLKMFDNGSGQFNIDFSQIEGKFPRGYPLEMTSYQNGKVNSSSRAISVDPNPKQLDLSGYQAQSMMGNQ